MRRLRFGFIASLAFTFFCPGAYAAQEPEQLRPDWLAADYKSVELISLLASPGPLTVQAIRDILKMAGDGEERDLGFGASNFELAKGHAYTTLYVEGFVFKGTIGFYRVGISASSETWPRIRARVIRLWKHNRGPEFIESESGIVHTETNEAVLRAYQAAVSAELGEMKHAEIPDALKKSFEYLTSPLEQGVFGAVEGEIAIDALVNANRVDLIENVLRGFSLSGRVYAASALLKLTKTKQVLLSPDVVSTIAKVRNLDISITIVRGCIVSYLTANEILSAEENPEPL